jgi:hypothetical protein
MEGEWLAAEQVQASSANFGRGTVGVAPSSMT